MIKNKSKISVNEAYCVELGKIVSVKEMELSLSSFSPCKSPHFLCATKACRNGNVKMSIVGYEQRLNGEDSDVPIHFRLFPKHRHDVACQWHPMSNSDLKNTENVNQGSKESSHSISTSHNPKQDDKINYFNLQLDTEGTLQDSGIISPVQVANNSSQNNTSSDDSSNSSQRTSTNSFDRIIDEFIVLEQRQMLDSSLTIRGLGTKSYRHFFRPHKTISYDFEKFILYGNLTRYSTIYENSFCLYFFDHINNSKGNLYIDFEQYADSRRKEALLRTITEYTPDEIKYFRVFFIATNRIQKTYGTPQSSPQNHKIKYEYVIPSLEFLQIKRYLNKT